MTHQPKHYVLHAETGSLRLVGMEIGATLWDGALMRMKVIREKLGHTHQKQMANAAAWHSLARSFHRAAKILNEFADSIPSDSRPFAFNAGLSLELVFKAILAKKQLAIPSGNRGHD